MASCKAPYPRRTLSRSLSASSTQWKHTAQDESYGDTFMSRMHDVLETKQYCDITLLVGTEKIEAHKVVLVAFSQYFEALFNPNMKEGVQNEIELHNVPPGDFKTLLHYAYSGKVEITDATVESLMCTANYFGIDFVCSMCCHYLKKYMTLDNCLAIRELAEAYDQLQLKEDSRQYICHRFSKVAESDDFLEMGEPMLCSLLQGDQLLVTLDDIIPTISQQRHIVQNAIEKWIRHDEQNRSGYREKAMDRVKNNFVPGANTDVSGVMEITAEGLPPWRLKKFVAFRAGPTYADGYQLRHAKVDVFNIYGSLRIFSYICGMDIYIRRWDDRPVLGGLYIYFNDGNRELVGDTAGPDKYSFSLAENERIIGAQVHSGWLIDQMTFTTNLGRQLGPYGGDGGGECPKDSRIEGSYGFLAGVRGDIVFDQGSKSITHMDFMWTEYWENGKPVDPWIK